MTIASVVQKLRPLRIAILVNPNSKQDIYRAIEFNSMFWGGILNPIIPCYTRRPPLRWERRPATRRLTAREITDGYIAAFDPDIIVPLSEGLEGHYDTGSSDVLQPEKLLGNMLKTGSPSAGVGALELMDHIARSEFKYVRQHPLSIILPAFADRDRLFLASVFGCWPPDLVAAAKEFFGSTMPIAEPSCTVKNFHELLGTEYLFPRRIGLVELDYQPTRPCVYCLDDRAPLDVLDYWNLRAAGYYTIPAPRSSFSSPSFRSWIRSFVDEHRDPDGLGTTFQVGRSLNEEEVIQLVRSLEIAVSDEHKRPAYSVRTWYPRIWDRWAHENSNGQFRQCYSGEDEETSVDGFAGKVELGARRPPFQHWGTWSGLPRCANEISYSVYGSEQPMAEVLPEGRGQLAASFHIGGTRQVRLSRSGPVYFVKPYEQRISFQIPKAESFMLEWFRTNGWEVELSSPGLVATQMLKRLGGSYGLHTINSKRLLSLLDKHASEKRDSSDPQAPRAPKWIEERALGAEIGRIIKDEGSHFDKARYVLRLLEQKVLGLGLQLHCPVCLRWMWCSVEQLKAEVECEQCLSAFPIALAPKKEREWSYKPIGPFNVRGFGGGAYPVLLAWKFFAGQFDRPTTPLLSFIAKKEQFNGEIDLAFFCQYRRWDTNRNDLVFVECKAYDTIQAADINRMATLSREFPGAVLVFAKFSNSMDASESRRLTRLVNQQRKLRHAGKPHSPIVILGEVEMFSYWGAPECWRDKSGRHSVAYERWSNIDSLVELAEATQHLYLGIEPFRTSKGK